MSVYFKLNYSGLNYLISSSEDCDNRNFILHLLSQNIYTSASMSQLQAMNSMDKKQLTLTIYKMLRNEWLSSIETSDVRQPARLEFNLSHHLQQLSTTGSALLADMNGLVLSATGFTQEEACDLAASATSLLIANSAVGKRIKSLSTSTPCVVSFQWGDKKTNAQLINIGSLEFILVIEDTPHLNCNDFFHLIANLARRYSNV